MYSLFPGRKIVVLDAETTGIDRSADEVIELAITLYGNGQDPFSATYRFRPTVPIRKKAFETHGISEEDLEEKPRFEKWAEYLFGIFSRADVVVGFNVDFDTDILVRQFSNSGLGNPFEGKTIVDPYRLEQALVPRTLEALYEWYTGNEIVGAHGAEADVAATEEVLRNQVARFGLNGKTAEEIEAIARPDKRFWIGGTNHLLWDDGRVTIGFGKHNQTPVYELSPAGRKYVSWILSKDFPEHVKTILQAYLHESNEEPFSIYVDHSFSGDRYAEAEVAA